MSLKSAKPNCPLCSALLMETAVSLRWNNLSHIAFIQPPQILDNWLTHCCTRCYLPLLLQPDCLVECICVNVCRVVPHSSASRPLDVNFPPPQEPYDDDDRARQLALGTMMLRKHRAKEMVDAAYNRFSWNDDADLPDWFVDDEKKHHRPQVPIALPVSNTAIGRVFVYSTVL